MFEWLTRHFRPTMVASPKWGGPSYSAPVPGTTGSTETANANFRGYPSNTGYSVIPHAQGPAGVPSWGREHYATTTPNTRADNMTRPDLAGVQFSVAKRILRDDVYNMDFAIHLPQLLLTPIPPALVDGQHPDYTQQIMVIG